MEKPVKVVIVLFLFSIVGFFAYTQFKSWHRTKMETAVEQAREIWEGKIDRLGKEVDNLKGLLTHDNELTEIRTGAADDTKTLILSIPPGTVKLSCEQLKKQMATFFAHLDQREYMAAHDLEGGTYELFVQIVEELTRNPPVITGEMDDLSALIRNVTHFYRVFGKKRIELIIDILKNESKTVEAIMETFYQWILIGIQCKDDLISPPPLEIVYRYADFFLNTLGGRSYLLRRDSKTRVLTSYYSILILDHSNEKVKNTYGIDIRPYIDFSFYDIKSQKALAYQDRYLTKLEDLKKKYRM